MLDTCRVHASINTGASSPLTPCTRPAAASAARCSGRTAPPVRLFATVAAACPRGLDPFRPTEKLKLDHRRRAVVDVIVDRRTFGVEPERRRRAVQWSPRVAPRTTTESLGVRTSPSIWTRRTQSNGYQGSWGGRYFIYRPPPVGISFAVHPSSWPRRRLCFMSWLAGAPPRRSDSLRRFRASFSRFTVTAIDESLRGWRGRRGHRPPPAACSPGATTGLRRR